MKKFGGLKYRLLFLCLLWFVVVHGIEYYKFMLRHKFIISNHFLGIKESCLIWGGLSFLLLGQKGVYICTNDSDMLLIKQLVPRKLEKLV
jgi:hypothetical protein